MALWITALGMVVCMLTSSLFMGHSPTRERALWVTVSGVMASIGLWSLLSLSLDLQTGLTATVLLSALLIAMAASELTSGLRRRVDK